MRAEPATVTVRIVALSGHRRPEDKARSREAGFDDRMTKPVGVEQLGRVLGAGA